MVRKMMIVLAVLLSCGAPASATLINIVFSGRVAVFNDGSYGLDELALFGPRNGLLDGQSFTALFVVDDAAMGANYVYGPSSSSASGGLGFGGASPVSASLTINGTTVDLDLPPFGSPSVNTGSITKTLAPSSFNASFAKYNGGSPYSAELNFNVAPAQPFTSSDFREPLSTGLALSYDVFPNGAPNGFAFLQAATPDGPDGMIVPTTTALSLVADRLSVAAAVPEPATWVMFIGGFGLIGGAMRRRQRVNVSFA
jgi:hypothetical protein